MTTATKLLAFTIFIGLAFASPLDIFYITYPLMPYSLIQNLQGAWKFCGENNTNAERYKEIFDKTTDCYGNLLQNNQSICRSFENNIQNCSQSLVDFYVDCLPQKSKDLPPAILKATVSVVEGFCTSSGELLLEVFNPCFQQLTDKNLSKECQGETLKPKVDKLKTDLPSKAEACQLGEELGSCLQEAVKQNCQAIKARELVTTFYNAAHSACK